MARILVAMSGGVDSSVVAALLVEPSPEEVAAHRLFVGRLTKALWLAEG